MNGLTQETIKIMREILEGSFDGILVADGKGVVIMMNESYVRNTGLTKKELLGRYIGELINPVWMKESVVLLAIEQRQSVSLQHTTRNGKNVIVTGRPLFNSDGSVKMVVVNTRDMSEIIDLQEELQDLKRMESIYLNQLRENTLSKSGLLDNEIVVGNSAMQKIYSLAGKVAPFDITVLITGESGVGKEVIAKYLHRNNPKRNKHELVTVNCAAIPNDLLESELFGYVEGAFSGAAKGGKIGLFEAANGGTLFLDEIGEIKPGLQAKLLRALESNTITRVGSTKEIPLNLRIVAATNRDLAADVAAGRFREDLYYRLNVVGLEIPPLRERIDEIGALTLNFVTMFNAKYGQNKKLTHEVVREFENYEWKGNIRQLKNVVENMVVVSDHEYLRLGDIPWLKGISSAEEIALAKESSLSEMMSTFEKHILETAKRKYGSSRKIAAALKAEQSTIVRKLKKYNIS